uniref:NmrA-like domain-containing protein n=1 Tax=Skeletonema marinoi TaxID=267567 RepID=A0A7S2PST3_9STRA|mmetsp:Transcript_30387/g.51661  ORF Transcript_30387/g.51661 Transcript_30387/m.51661 type:complete len:318 (+) Transcript_30387:1106-2059(+)
MTTQTYLVFSATGRQGRAVINALVSKGETSIVATSRNPESTSSQALLKIDGVTKVIKADYNAPDSIYAAIKESQATRIWFTTDFWSIPWLSRTRETETKLGSCVIDAIVKANQADECQTIEHVVYSSVGDADNAPKEVGHFWGKAGVEKYMASQFDTDDCTTTWSVIRPVAFFENLDDAANFNPLTKGTLKFLTYPDKKSKFIACEDIGKGSAVLLTDPKEYAGKIIEAAGAEHTALELTAALSDVSGTVCNYAMAMPRFVMWLLMGDLFHMITWMETDGYSASIEEFKKLVPDAQDARAFFESKGQWANGEKFVSS